MRIELYTCTGRKLSIIYQGPPTNLVATPINRMAALVHVAILIGYSYNNIIVQFDVMITYIPYI